MAIQLISTPWIIHLQRIHQLICISDMIWIELISYRISHIIITAIISSPIIISSHVSYHFPSFFSIILSQDTQKMGKPSNFLRSPEGEGPGDEQHYIQRMRGTLGLDERHGKSGRCFSPHQPRQPRFDQGWIFVATPSRTWEHPLWVLLDPYKFPSVFRDSWLGILPQNLNMEPENRPLEKGSTSSKSWFLGSMLVFGGVVWERGPMLFGGPWKSHWLDEDDVFFFRNSLGEAWQGSLN